MTDEKLYEVIGDISDKYIREAKQERSSHTSLWFKWGALTACFVGVVVTAFGVLPNFLNNQSVAPPNDLNGVVANNPNKSESQQQDTSQIHICMDDIFLNEIDTYADRAKLYYDENEYNMITWDMDEMVDYFGKDFLPSYIPDGLTAAPGNDTVMVITDKDGKMVDDTVWFGYYHVYYEDGSPKLTEDIAAVKGFSLTASRLGIVNDVCYDFWEDEVQTSDIAGVPVTFGYLSMPYGPYDPDTHEPSGYFDMYVAEFEQEGIEYQIVADQLELEEVVKVVSSIICGENVSIEIDEAEE